MHIADKVQYCASCFGQYLDRQHVDFEAFWDGPALKNEKDENNPLGVDDLIICEKCLMEAGKLIGLEHAEKLKKENEELGAAVESHLEQVLARDELISDLERTVEKLTGEKIIRPARKPKILASVD